MNLKSNNKIHIEGGMSALSDIIFMLLIFFVIASSLAVNGEQVNLPKTSTGTPSQSTVTVTITRDLRYLVDNYEMNKDEVETHLQGILANSNDKKVILNVDRDVPTGETIELFSILKKNNWQPFIATKPKE
ncbi:MAG: biopolymer transporter ExbD [Crocinitomicaceae bacterium]|nr:biopolymer transporter ExbD [Crocinitomicaceae bacterium]